MDDVLLQLCPFEDPVHDRYLSADKEYHVFISYKTEDASFVKNLRIHLEEKLKFKCMLAEHFTPGEPVIDNMSNAYPKCEKVLFVVSKDFSESGYCDNEVNLAHTYAMENRQKNYIIVLKIDDSPVHSKLRVCTYIDGVDRDIDEIGHKFEMAYTGSVTVKKDKRNGATLFRKFPEEESPSLCGGMNYVFPDISENEMVQLRASHIEDSATCYKDIQTEINKTRLLILMDMAGQSGQTKACCAWIGICTGVLAFLVSIVAFMYWFNVGPEGHEIFVIVIPITITTCYCSCIIYAMWTTRINRRMSAGLQSIVMSKMSLKRNKYAILPRMTCVDENIGHGRHLVFIYYDVAPCWKYFKEHVEWSDTSEEYIDETCERLFKEAMLFHYGDGYLSIPLTINPRHQTETSCRCLCQLLDQTRTDLNTAERLRAKILDSQIDDGETRVMKIVGTESVGDVTCEMENDDI